jgi:hypothetical protein
MTDTIRSLPDSVIAEGLGSTLLAATVVGAAIMAERFNCGRTYVPDLLAMCGFPCKWSFCFGPEDIQKQKITPVGR